MIQEACAIALTPTWSSLVYRGAPYAYAWGEIGDSHIYKVRLVAHTFGTDDPWPLTGVT